MSGIEYYGMDGQPITWDGWAALHEDMSGRRVAETDLPGGV